MCWVFLGSTNRKPLTSRSRICPWSRSAEVHMHRSHRCSTAASGSGAWLLAQARGSPTSAAWWTPPPTNGRTRRDRACAGGRCRSSSGASGPPARGSVSVATRLAEPACFRQRAALSGWPKRQGLDAGVAQTHAAQQRAWRQPLPVGARFRPASPCRVAGAAAVCTHANPITINSFGSIRGRRYFNILYARDRLHRPAWMGAVKPANKNT